MVPAAEHAHVLAQLTRMEAAYAQQQSRSAHLQVMIDAPTLMHVAAVYPTPHALAHSQNDFLHRTARRPATFRVFLRLCDHSSVLVT